jgi:fumarate reductase subunit D
MSIQSPTKSVPFRQAELAGNRVAQTRLFELLARAGFVSRAVIYGVVGVLAVKLALGAGGKATDQSGALKTIAHQPFGQVLLILVAIGLAGYSLWRLVHALLGHGPEKSDTTLDRVAALGSGIAYGVICAIAVKILLESGSGRGTSGSTSKAAGGVLGWPAGVWLVGIAGAVVIGIALYQAYRGVTTDFLKDAKTEQMGATIRHWYTRTAVVGFLARAVVFGLIGIFLIKAAVDYNPSKAVGLDGALAKLVHQSYGSALLGVVAGGLIAFAIYSLADARYRRI